jgi:hypothetical protein
MKLKNAIKNWLFKHYLNAVVAEDIVTQDKFGNIYLGNIKLTAQEIKNIKEEIKFIETTRIWRIYIESLKEQAQKSIFDKAQTMDDLFAGKMMLYNLDIMLKINNIFKR